jgi:hypothetical protein
MANQNTVSHPQGDVGPSLENMTTGYVPFEPKKRELTQKVA